MARFRMRHRLSTRVIAGVAVGVLLVMLGAVAIIRGDRSVAPAALNAPIAVDPEVRWDTLPNGLRYAIMPNVSRDNRTSVRLVVNAGSLHEDEDQRGLAHAVEHMAIRGSQSFPRRAIDEYVQSLGMRRGEGVNGSTTMDDTQYRMIVPSDRDGALDTALAMLAGIAHDAVFDEASALPESAILLEEWRSGRDAYQRAADARHALLLAGTPYAERQVIGDTAVLRRFDLAAMRRFYQTWYRPDLMAVVVVGNVDPDRVDSLVVKHFSRLVRRSSPSPFVQALDSLPARPLRSAVVKDPETTETRIGIWSPYAVQPFATPAHFRGGLIAALWQNILETRLEEAALQPGSPIIEAKIEYRTLARFLRARVIAVLAMKDRSLDALEATAVELDRLARHGVTQDEFDESVALLLRRANLAIEAGESSEQLALELADKFLSGNVPLTNAKAYELSRELLPTIRPADVMAFAHELPVDDGAFVIASAPLDDSLWNATPDQITARVRSIARDTKAPASIPLPQKLVTREPLPGKTVAERRLADITAWEWTLGNGLKVFIKPTTATFNDVQLRAVLPGGASLASDADYPSAYLADAFIGTVGVGAMSGSRLNRWLQTTSISLGATVGDDAISFEGSAETGDLERLFQLLHLLLTSPRNDTVAFDRYRERMRSLRRDHSRNPDHLFVDSLSSIVSGHHPRARTHAVDFLDRANLGTALEFWKARTANAGNTTVAVTGDFTLDRIRSLVERYLGSLPAGVREAPRDVGGHFPSGITTHEIRSGVSETARTAIVFSGFLEITEQSVGALASLRDLIELALHNTLRESLGGTYQVDVTYHINPVPPAEFGVTVMFESSPQRMESLTRVAITELQRLKRAGPSLAEFEATRATRMRDYDGMVVSNAYWANELLAHSRFGWPFSTITSHAADLERMTLADLRAIAAEYIRTDAYVRFTMRPGRRAPGD